MRIDHHQTGLGLCDCDLHTPNPLETRFVSAEILGPMFRHLYLAITLLVAVAVAFSAVMKIRHDLHAVRTIHGAVGVPLSYFSFLAAYQLAGALGLILGVHWPLVGIVAGIGLIVYFVTAILMHITKHDFEGLRAAVLMFFAVAIALTMRLHLGPHPHWYKF